MLDLKETFNIKIYYSMWDFPHNTDCIWPGKKIVLSSVGESSILLVRTQVLGNIRKQYFLIGNKYHLLERTGRPISSLWIFRIENWSPWIHSHLATILPTGRIFRDWCLTLEAAGYHFQYFCYLEARPLGLQTWCLSIPVLYSSASEFKSHPG